MDSTITAALLKLLPNLVQSGLAKPKAEPVYQASSTGWQGAQEAGQPWDDYTPEQHAQMVLALQRLDDAKQFQSAGNLYPQGRNAFAEVAHMGGLDEQQALLAARYRMAHLGLGPVPQGERQPFGTPEQVQEARAKFFAAKPGEERGAAIADLKGAQYLDQEGHYDSLGKPKRKTLSMPEPR